MQSFEYRVVPAPRRGEKVKGAKTSEDRFAVALMRVMNTLGAEGWEYVRADTLPCDERTGLTGVKTSYLNMLVFRRSSQTGATLTVDDTDTQKTQPFNALRVLNDIEESPAARSVGAPGAPSGAAPALGPARQDQVAE